MNSPNPAYYEALATARGVRPAPARSWSILLTSTNHGVVGPRGSTFPHAGEHHERVVVVEVPAGAGAPVDQVDLKLVSGAGAAAADAHPAPGHFAVTKLEEVISWVAQLPVPTRGACTMINKLREARYALLAAPVAAQAGQVAVPEGWKLVPVESCGKMTKAGEKALRKLLGSTATTFDAYSCYAAMLAAAPSAPAVAQQAPAQAAPIPQPGGVCANCHCADGEDCPSYAQASTAGERQEGGAA